MLSATTVLAQNISVNAGANGFTGWTEQNTSGNGSENGRFLGASGTSMDTSSQSWGLYANTGQTASNIYTFGETLTPGDYVEIKLSLGNIGSGGTVGFGLQNSTGTNRFETYYIGFDSNDSFKLNDSGGQENITGVTTTFASSSWSNSAFQTIRFTLGASNTYTLSFNGNSVTNTGLTIAASDIDRIRIFNFNAGSGGPSNQYFNSLEVVPEPSTLAMLAFGAGGGLLLWRRRRS
ncbi:MAG: hypothetical protein Fur0032_09080 [Terrimicrobiaceae bacterium]